MISAGKKTAGLTNLFAGAARFAQLAFRTLLYALFSVWLLIPAIRRARRRPDWSRFRLGGAWLGAALAAAGLVMEQPILLASGAVLLLLAAALAPAADPDALRRLADKLGARHILNGGFHAGGLAVETGAPLLLFVNTEEVLVASAPQPQEILTRLALAALEQVLLDGEIYAPRYVSFAKAPPARSEKDERGAACRLCLRFGPAARPSTLDIRYQGAFARHLGEVAAHTLDNARKLSAPDRIAGQPPEVLHVIGGQNIPKQVAD